jgi:hypothetical protein
VTRADSSFDSDVKSPSTSAQLGSATSKTSSVGLRTYWKVTETTNKGRDELVNVYRTSSEASAAARDLEAYDSGRQFTCRLGFGSMPNEKHWQGYDMNGKWVGNYETWEKAEEELKASSGNLVIRLVGGPFTSESEPR